MSALLEEFILFSIINICVLVAIAKIIKQPSTISTSMSMHKPSHTEDEFLFTPPRIQLKFKVLYLMLALDVSHSKRRDEWRGSPSILVCLTLTFFADCIFAKSFSRLTPHTAVKPHVPDSDCLVIVLVANVFPVLVEHVHNKVMLVLKLSKWRVLKWH